MKPQKILLLTLISAFALILAVPRFVKADGATSTPPDNSTSTVVNIPPPVNINFDVEGPSSTIFSGAISVPACATPNNATSTVNGFCAFAAANLPVDATWSSYGALVNSIDNIAGDANNYWLWFLNGDPAQVGIDSYMLNPNDTVLWTLGREPLKVSLSTTTPTVDATTTVTVMGFNPNNFDFEPLAGALVTGAATTTDANGIANVVATSTNPFTISVSADGYIPSQEFTINPLPQYPHQIVLSTSSIISGQSFTATAQQFDTGSHSYKPLTGVTLGVGTANPDSTSTTFTEIATSTVDSTGQAAFTLNTPGTFQVGIKEDGYFPTVDITVTDASSTNASTTLPNSGGTSGSTGGGGGVTHSNLNIPAALAFISAAQNSDGSFATPIITDWTAIAFAAENPGTAKTKLYNYLLNATPAITAVTDDERHAMALEALGINPYSGTSVNYISAITNAFDGTQIGTPDDNDDIFGLIVLEHAGYTSGDTIIQKDAAFVLSTQEANGSWDASPDLTAAAIQALGGLFDLNGVNAALGQAAGYLASTEQPNGGWGNVDSTSWVQTAINGIIQTQTPGFTNESAWSSSQGLYPTDALAAAQVGDGGVESANRVWSTSYAVVGASGQSWVSILQSFPKPAVSQEGGGGTSLVTPTSTTANLASSTPGTSTPVTLATSTPASTTSTLPTIPTIQLAVQSPTATPVSNRTPKFKKLKPRVKISRATAAAPAVLGESTIKPLAPVQQTPPPAKQPKTNRPGLFKKSWDAIITFFARLF